MYSERKHEQTALDSTKSPNSAFIFYAIVEYYFIMNVIPSAQISNKLWRIYALLVNTRTTNMKSLRKQRPLKSDARHEWNEHYFISVARFSSRVTGFRLEYAERRK